MSHKAFAVACLVGAAACAERRPPAREPLREVCAPVPPCPSLLDALRENRAVLHVYAFDAVSRTPACTRGGVVEVTVLLDEVPVGLAELPCAEEIRVPPFAVRIEGKAIDAGLHELRITARTARGTIEAAALLSLPAFDVARDGTALVVGAEIGVTIGADDVAIAPPQVYPPKVVR